MLVFSRDQLPSRRSLSYCSSFPSRSRAKHVRQRFIITPASFFNETASTEKTLLWCRGEQDVEGIVHLKMKILSSFTLPRDLVYSVGDAQRRQTGCCSALFHIIKVNEDQVCHNRRTTKWVIRYILFLKLWSNQTSLVPQYQNVRYHHTIAISLVLWYSNDHGKTINMYINKYINVIELNCIFYALNFLHFLIFMLWISGSFLI